jgi:hypothetical protein
MPPEIYNDSPGDAAVHDLAGISFIGLLSFVSSDSLLDTEIISQKLAPSTRAWPEKDSYDISH